MAALMTAAQLARKHKARKTLVEKEFRKSMRGLGISAVAFTRMKLTEEIYAFPIPKRPRSGKPAWKRTGALRRGERYQVTDAYTVQIVNDVSYAKPRHEAGKPGRRVVRYPSHWRDELVEAFRGILADVYEATMSDILEKG